MGERLDQQPDAHDVGQAEAPLERAVGDGPDHATDRDRGGQQAEAHRAHAEPLAGVQDEHGPRRAVGDVEREDREREGPHRRVREQPADALGHLVAEAPPLPAAPASGSWRPARRAPRRARTPRRSRRTAGPCRLRTGRRRSAVRPAGSWSGRRPASARWRCPGPRARTMPGSSVLLAESANVSAVPSTKSTTRIRAMLTLPVTIVAVRTASTPARRRFATTTIRRRSNRSAATPPMTPKRSTGRYSVSSASDTRNGSRVCEATSSGPAATTTPSPTLLTTVADSSQRKLDPSLPGATTSTNSAQASGATVSNAAKDVRNRVGDPLAQRLRFTVTTSNAEQSGCLIQGTTRGSRMRDSIADMSRAGGGLKVMSRS